MINSLRSDKFAGPIAVLFGLGIAGFGAFGLAMVELQRLTMSKAPPAPFHFEEMMQAIHSTWITYFPFLIAGGLTLCVAGFFIYRGSRATRRIAQVTAVLGIIWIVAYSIASYGVIQTMKELPFAQEPIFIWAVIIVNVIYLLAFPAALLLVLSSPKKPT